MATIRGIRPLDGDRLVLVGEDHGRSALLVDGVVQSISPADAVRRGGYWAAMLPANPPRRALILGLGGGTIANLLARQWGTAQMEIVGVDHSDAVVDSASALEWLDLPNLTVVRSDAFDFVERCEQRFDYVAVDLYEGPDLVGQVLTKPFLQRLRERLGPPGTVAFNLFVDSRLERRVARLARVLQVERRVIVGSNLVVHARARR